MGGLFLAALNSSQAGHALLVPSANAGEVALSGHAAAFKAANLREAAIRLVAPDAAFAMPAVSPVASRSIAAGTLSDVIGQGLPKRALMIAAAGGHSLLMVGPPGTGKSMLATRLPDLLPPLSRSDALEVAAIASVAGAPLDLDRWMQRPFRSPHHTSSAHAIVGGGPSIRPGEISLAHQGVLFLDELPEFDRRVLESLREPLETGSITIARAGSRLELPAQFQLVAAMNPCPCGYLGDPMQACTCTPAKVERYRQRISGPLLDRIDMRVHVTRVLPEDLAAMAGANDQPVSAADHTARVQTARSLRESRSGAISARLSAAQLQRCCALSETAQRLLQRSCEQLGLSGRGMHRLLAISRTIADLAPSDSIEVPHLAEAIQLRRSLPGQLG